MALPEHFKEALQDEEKWRQLRPLRFGPWELAPECKTDVFGQPRHKWCQLFPRDYPLNSEAWAAWEEESFKQGNPRTCWLPMRGVVVEEAEWLLLVEGLQQVLAEQLPPAAATQRPATSSSSSRAQTFYACRSKSVPGPPPPARPHGRALAAPGGGVECGRTEVTERRFSPSSPAHENETQGALRPPPPLVLRRYAPALPPSMVKQESLQQEAWVK